MPSCPLFSFKGFRVSRYVIMILFLELVLGGGRVGHSLLFLILRAKTRRTEQTQFAELSSWFTAEKGNSY